ncbi:RCC1-like domain-containing protein [Mycetocola zhadangensis]|uniref:Uncharacterized protein n=1 Tax=Mycetocola zhadangensis TaxID=1164595 RepID=A0A3L7J4L4_9MICO|nr:RCC1 domain-containing protein [Mycetocola zhadangensis]RLQ85638.1 hypothetical protein D9V28_01810 [Mycetocola zhadangensis]
MSIAAGWLTRDGKVIAAGDRMVGVDEVSAWRSITAVSAGSYHTVAALEDGRVLAAGRICQGSN